jgi:diacylglycerol O-acyltransferase
MREADSRTVPGRRAKPAPSVVQDRHRERHGGQRGAGPARSCDVVTPRAGRRGASESVFDRLSPGDLTVLLTDRGNVPMNTGAILMFDDARGPAAPDLRALLADRAATVPRLRRRVHRLPLGGGGPIWVDDADFTIDRHLLVREVSISAGPQPLLDLAAELVCERLPWERPPWRACLVVDPASGVVRALVLVVHHVMTDGLGGLAVLAALADPGLTRRRDDFPRRRPGYGALARDAARQRWRRAATFPLRLRVGIAGLAELGVGRGPRHRAGTTSLTGRTSGQRRLRTVDAPLADLVAVAHTADGTVNDVVLTAVTDALTSMLARRGENPERLVVSVPVSGRAGTDSDHLGNHTGVRPLAIPLVTDDRTRLHTVAAITRSAAVGSSRASSAGPLGVAFRLLARLGLFSWFVDHQHLVDTFETNMRGPVERLHLGGHRVQSIIPIAVNPGNVGVSFDVLSYAGTLGITVVADPDRVPELDLLTELLADGLRRLCAL